MIFADLHVGNRFWKRDTNTNSLTSGPRSPTKIECSGPRSSRLGSVSNPWRIGNSASYLRSASPPPEAQFNLKGRLELGMMDPLRVSALAAAGGDWKSMKQYPALLLELVRIKISPEDGQPRGTYPENLSRIIFTLTVSPMLAQMVRTKFSSIQGSSSPILQSS